MTCVEEIWNYFYLFFIQKINRNFVYVYAMDLANTIFKLNFDDFNTCMKCYLGKYTDVNQ